MQINCFNDSSVRKKRRSNPLLLETTKLYPEDLRNTNQGPKWTGRQEWRTIQSKKNPQNKLNQTDNIYSEATLLDAEATDRSKVVFFVSTILAPPCLTPKNLKVSQ